jgi:hypothetical protein
MQILEEITSQSQYISHELPMHALTAWGARGQGFKSPRPDWKTGIVKATHDCLRRSTSNSTFGNCMSPGRDKVGALCFVIADHLLAPFVVMKCDERQVAIACPRCLDALPLGVGILPNRNDGRASGDP